MDERKDERATGVPRVIVPPVVVVLCALIGLANLAGWISGARILVSIASGLPAMVPATTILALLAAAGLWVHWRWPKRTGLARFFPALVIALCVAIGICYVAGAAPGPFRLAQSGHEFPASLPSPVTAFMFFLLGSALLLSATRTRLMVAQGIALAVCMLAVLNLGGYLFRDTVLFQLLPGRGTSIPTTAQAILLALGILFAHPRRGLMAAVTGNLPGAAISRRLLVSAFVVPVAAGTIAVIAADHGLHDTETTLPLFVWTMIVLFLLIMWRFALRLSSADVARFNAERELQGALRDLRAEQDRKDIFLATLAHELRNPLAPITAAAEVLRHGGGQTMEDRQRIGGIVAAQAGNLVDIVNDLLDIERLSSGRIALDRHMLDLRTPVAGALEQAQPLIARKEHACRVDLPPEPVYICGDVKRLVQILSNLLNNSAKYTPPRRDHRRAPGNPRRLGLRDGGRQWHRHRRRHACPRVRPLLPGRADARPDRRRPWYRPVAGQAPDGTAWRQRHGGQPGPRQGQQLHRHSAADAAIGAVRGRRGHRRDTVEMKRCIPVSA
ncbi:sensor histidine kinase [Pseudoduganella lutea]|uniref:histidine kinase n=1 Tax=Pseudoduganella lutea TaxID=321985 RepID=A0A4V0Z422_9BURK|nr:HAMP domain-containing sensor histidine kinase [Pseudoduganella lutea]QBE65433.1 HAMP domain-containing histidine kinase [Pseudoduganella lutea]